MSRGYVFEPRPVFSSYTPNLFLGTYYIEDGFQGDPSMWADPLEDAFVTNAGMKEGKVGTVTYLDDFSAETLLMGSKKLDELGVIPQSYFWKWVNYDGQVQIPTEMSEDDFESPAYERFMEDAVGYDSDNPYFLLVVDTFMDDGEDVDIWAEEADWNRMQTTARWWEIYDHWMENEGVDFLTTLAEENYDWAVSNAYELQQIGYEIPEPDDDDYYWSMRQAENEGHWMTFGQVDYNWATDPDDVELADVEFSEIDEYIRNEIRWEIDANNIPGEGDIDWAADREDGIHEEFTISYYWGPVQTTGVNSAESFSAETLVWKDKTLSFMDWAKQEEASHLKKYGAETIDGSFVINNNRGFSIGFDNGYALSVKFGPGTYSDNYAMSIYGNVAKARDAATEYIESSTAEIAVLKDGALMSFDEAKPTSQIMGWVPTSLIPSLLTAVSEGDDRKIRRIAKKHFDRDQGGDESYSYGAESFEANYADILSPLLHQCDLCSWHGDIEDFNYHIAYDCPAVPSFARKELIETYERRGAEFFEAPYTGAGAIMGIKGDTDLSSFTPDELTKSSAIHGDFDTASLDYSGHQNIEVRAEEDHLECSRCGDSSPVYFGILSLCKSCQKLVDSYPAYLRAELKRVSQALEELIYDLQTCDDCGGHREELDCTNVCNCGFLEEDQPKITQQYKSEEGDNEDWDDSDYYDPQDAWERSFETWMEEWVTGGATRTDILRVYAAKNGIGYRFGNSVDEIDVADAAAWYEGLTIAEREDEIVGADPFNLVGLSSTDPVELQKKVALFEALNEIIEDQMDSWDDQFQSENDYFDKYGGIYEDGRPCPFCGLNNMAENACGTPGNDMCNDCCSKSGGCGHCPVHCPACGNEDVNNLNGLEFSCDKCGSIWNI